MVVGGRQVGDAGSGSGNESAGGVNWHEAARFCNWMTTGDGLSGYYIITDGEASIPGQTHYEYAQDNGLTHFLPTEDEWYKAAYYDPSGSVYYDYPTGSDTIPTAEGPAGTDLINGSANYASAVGSRTIVGAYTNKPSDSPHGTFDQNGNAWEWCEDWIEPGPGPLQRGGGWIATGDTLMSNKRWSAGSPYEQHPDTGFRVSSLGFVTDVPGDVDGDQIVSILDLDLFEEQFGGTPGDPSADFDDDGDVDLDDFAVIRGNWGFGVVTAPPGGTATPEPATMSLLALGGLMVLRRRSRKA